MPIKTSYLIKNITNQNNCLFIPVMMAKSLLSSVSHDPSEIILICWFGA